MNRERVEELLAMAKEKLSGRVNMGSYYTNGAPACLAGHATSHPPFREAGLHWGERGGWPVPAFGSGKQKLGSYNALAAFFELSMQTKWLFSPSAYLGYGSEVPLSVVLAHIQGVLGGKSV